MKLSKAEIKYLLKLIAADLGKIGNIPEDSVNAFQKIPMTIARFTIASKLVRGLK